MMFNGLAWLALNQFVQVRILVGGLRSCRLRRRAAVHSRRIPVQVRADRFCAVEEHSQKASRERIDKHVKLRCLALVGEPGVPASLSARRS
jgi:hypothetical protein